MKELVKEEKINSKMIQCLEKNTREDGSIYFRVFVRFTEGENINKEYGSLKPYKRLSTALKEFSKSKEFYNE